MKRSEKIELILEDDRQQRIRRMEKLEELSALFNSPHFAEDEFGDEFEYKTIPEGANYRTILDRDIPQGKAAVITHIGNEWYPGITHRLKMDEREIKLEREFGSPEEPAEVDKLVRDRIVWDAKNDNGEGYEDRVVGVLVKGYYIPVEFYESIADIHHGSI